MTINLDPDKKAAIDAAMSLNIPSLAFRERFSAKERFAIKQAAEAAAKADDFDLFDMWDRVASAAVVDIKDAQVVNGVRAIESLGLIAAGRADEILAEEPVKPPDTEGNLQGTR